MNKKVWQCPKCDCTLPPKAYHCSCCKIQLDTNYNVIANYITGKGEPV